MAEQPSNTSNHQRLDEMMAHLTPKGAVIPYTVCFDAAQNIWVGSKGGLFKLDMTGEKVLFERRNPFPKKIGAYTQVVPFENKIVYVMSEQQTTEFRIFDLDGNMEHEQFIDGRIQSFAVNADGDIFMTKQPSEEESIIYKASMDSPYGWQELTQAYDYCFQAICAYDCCTLAVATSTAPVNIYSKQSLKWIDSTTGKIIGSFSESGRDEGQIYFPRSIQRYKDDILVLDKTGRFQRFDRDGKLVEISARIDAYIGNGFVVRGDEAVMACTGIVIDKNKESICDDWIESIKLNGSCWTKTDESST